MPDRTYTPGQHPRIRDHILAHPFEVGLSVVLVLIGTRGLLDASSLPGSVQALPAWLSIAFAGLSVAGGALTIVGLLFSRAKTAGIEQAGLWLSAGAWASYTVGLIDQVATARGSLIIGAMAALAAASVVRAIALHLTVTARLAGLQLAAKARDDA